MLRGWGVADTTRDRSVDPAHTVFRVGSNSKALTATAVLHLAANHDIDLHDDLRPLLKDLPIRPPLDRTLTLHHLLTQSAGFNERLFGQHATHPADWQPLSSYLRRHLPPRFIPPGEIIAYNDHHTALAGFVIEKVSGLSFSTYVERNVFEPLGMTLSTFRQTELPDTIEQRIASGHYKSGDGARPYKRDFIHTAPAAGLMSTAADMGRYIEALLSNGATSGNKVLSESDWRRQKEIQFRQHPLLTGRAYGFAENTINGVPVLYKDGQVTGFNARLLLIPDHDAGLFVAHNASILGTVANPFLPTAKFNRELSEFVIEQLVPPESRNMAQHHGDKPEYVRPAHPNAYAGYYRTTVGSRHTMERLITMFDDVSVHSNKDGTLNIGGFDFMPIGGDLFQYIEGGSSHRAFRVENGRATHLFLGSASYQRIPWFGYSNWTLRFAIAFPATFLILALLAGWLRSRHPHGSTEHRLCGLALSLPLGALFFLFAFGSAIALTDIQVLFKGWPWWIQLARITVFIPIALTAWLAFETVRTFRLPLRTSVRVLLPVLLAVAAAFTGWLDYWRITDI